MFTAAKRPVHPPVEAFAETSAGVSPLVSSPELARPNLGTEAVVQRMDKEEKKRSRRSRSRSPGRRKKKADSSRSRSRDKKKSESDDDSPERSGSSSASPSRIGKSSKTKKSLVSRLFDPKTHQRRMDSAVDDINEFIRNRRIEKKKPHWNPPENMVRGQLLERTAMAQLQSQHSHILDTNAYVPNSAGVDLVGLDGDDKPPTFYQCKNFASASGARSVIHKSDADAQRMVSEVGGVTKKDELTQKAQGWKNMASSHEPLKKLFTSIQTADPNDLEEHETVDEIEKNMRYIVPSDVHGQLSPRSSAKSIPSQFTTAEFAAALAKIPHNKATKKSQDEKDEDYADH
jgi:hypothetical protein